MGENGLRVPPVFVYNEDMRKKGINMSRVSLWAAVCLLSSFSIQAETVAPEGCGLSGRIGELPHLYAPPMLGNGDVTCAFEPDGGMSTNNFSRLVPGIYRAGRRRPLPDCGLFCFGRVKSVCTSAAGGFRVRLDLKAGRLVRLDVEARNPAPGKSIRLRGRKGLFSAVRPVPGSTRLIPGEETDDLTVCTEWKGPVILIDPPRAGLPGSGDPRA